MTATKTKTLLIESSCPGAIVVPGTDALKPTIIRSGRSEMPEDEWRAVEPRLGALSTHVKAIGQAL